ncbi:MAG: hypothetical protein H6563_02605 [Lewinellaceae bacterium]|nr:hypothetical protein [Lewinellaceae bacterium]
MKKHSKILFLSFFILTALLTTACQKEEECLTGKVRFTNTSSNPYNLFIDGSFEIQMPGNSFRELDLLEGQHAARVEQVSGYILYPTIVNQTLNVFGCQEIEWVFP